MSTKQLKCGVQLIPNWKGGEPIPVPNSTVCKLFYTIDNLKPDYKKCRCGVLLKHKENTGYSTLLNHLHNLHKDEWQDEVKQHLKEVDVDEQSVNKSSRNMVQSTLNLSSVTLPSTKAKNLYLWIDGIVDNDLPISICESLSFNKMLSLESIGRKTLMKYIYLLTINIELKIKKKLRHIRLLALNFDMWEKMVLNILLCLFFILMITMKNLLTYYCVVHLYLMNRIQQH